MNKKISFKDIIYLFLHLLYLVGFTWFIFYSPMRIEVLKEELMFGSYNLVIIMIYTVGLLAISILFNATLSKVFYQTETEKKIIKILRLKDELKRLKGGK